MIPSLISCKNGQVASDAADLVQYLIHAPPYASYRSNYLQCRNAEVLPSNCQGCTALFNADSGKVVRMGYFIIALHTDLYLRL